MLPAAQQTGTPRSSRMGAALQSRRLQCIFNKHQNYSNCLDPKASVIISGVTPRKIAGQASCGGFCLRYAFRQRGELRMRKLFVWLLIVGWLGGSSPSYSQNYPVKPVTIIVTAAPGGVSDIVARALAQRLSEKWRQQVVVENRGGASHIAGAHQVAKAAADGHTLLVAEAGTYVINPIIYPKDKIPYDVQTDLIQVTGLVRIHHGLLVTSSLPIKTLAELIWSQSIER